MKTKIFLMVIALFMAHVLFAQTLVVDSRFGDTYTHQQGDLIMTSTLGSPIPATDYQNNLVVVTDHINLPFTTDTTSTHDLMDLKGIRVFPNPTPDLLVLQRDNWEKDYSIDIFQSIGQVLEKLIWDQGIQTIQISLKQFPTGVYFLTIMDGEYKSVVSYKIQKQ